MHNADDKHPTRPGFECSTSEFRATTGPNDSSEPRHWVLKFNNYVTPTEGGRSLRDALRSVVQITLKALRGREGLKIVQTALD